MLRNLVSRRTAKAIIHSSESRAKMLQGVDKLADAVQVTMGPKGRNVVIEQSFGSPKVTKDGVTVAKAIELADKTQNLGANLIKSVASKTNDMAGDGTTTATVLARAIFKEGCKAVSAGMNPMDLKRGIDLAVKKVIEHLKSNAKEISDPQEIEQVATIAANGDTLIGGLIAKAFNKVGKNGTITITEGKSIEHELDLVEGMKLDRGYVSPYFITDNKTQKVELENPFILICDKKISSIHSIINVLEFVVKESRPLLIISDDLDGEALGTLVLNKLRGGLKVCAIKAPGFGDNRKSILEDIAILTGGQVISEETGTKLEQITTPEEIYEILGTCKNLSVSKDSTVLMNGESNKDLLDERIELIKNSIDTCQSEYEKDKLKERLSKLTGGVAVIKVGGHSEVEVGEIKDRLDDALCATRAAIEEGIVPGGGSALLRASEVLEKVDEKEFVNFDMKIGAKIVESAVKIPLKTIIENAGLEGSVIAGKLMGQDYQMGFDAQRGEFVNMFEKGIIDPVKVVRTALADAASVASLMTTTEAVIVEEVVANKNASSMGMGEMGMGNSAMPMM